MTQTLKGISPKTGGQSYTPKESGLFREVTSRAWESGRSTTPSPTYPWKTLVESITKDVLGGHEDNLEYILARPEGNVVDIYALITTTEYDHDLSMALARLEVKVARSLSSHYEDVRLHLVPSWGLTSKDRESMLQGALRLL